MAAQAAEASAVGGLVLRAGFKDVQTDFIFREATTKKGEKLRESGHVFDVNERVSTASSVLNARCVRQASVSQEAYSITIKVSARSSMLRKCFVRIY